MKIPFLAAVGCLAATGALAGTLPSDFASVPWSAGRNDARRLMAEQGVEFDAGASNEKVLLFSGGKFAGEEAARWELRFEGGQFVYARVQLNGGGKANSLYRRMVTLLSDKYGSANEKQVAHRLPPHFEYGLGWLNSGSSKPPLHADWVVESALSGRTMVISSWVDGDSVQVQYQHHATKPLGGNLPANKKARPADDL